jgi:uncharacterized protein YdeI (YjbR/CyaY-like superfamily)
VTAKAKRFRALLEKDNRALSWTIARVPLDPARAWKQMVRLRVRGDINGFAFRTSLFPDARGGFYLLVNRAMQQGAAVSLGETADFRLEPDLEPREAELPDELAVLLDQEPGLRGWYGTLTEYMRREIGKWVMDVKSDEARLRRAQQMAERLLATMEGERELPPALAAAFRARPKARAGWAKMTPTQRRGELMAVFYYRTVEGRERRIEKLCDAAERRS